MEEGYFQLAIFQGKEIRREWHKDEWWFSVVDIVGALTDSSNPRNYWSMLKTRESEQGIELSTNCVQLKLQSADGKYYETDCANTEGIFRIIQSIPSPKELQVHLQSLRLCHHSMSALRSSAFHMPTSIRR